MNFLERYKNMTFKYRIMVLRELCGWEMVGPHVCKRGNCHLLYIYKGSILFTNSFYYSLNLITAPTGFSLLLLSLNLFRFLLVLFIRGLSGYNPYIG